MCPTAAQLVRCFQVVYQKKYCEQLRIAASLPRAQKKDTIAALQASQVMTELAEEHLDASLRPYKIFSRRGKAAVV